MKSRICPQMKKLLNFRLLLKGFHRVKILAVAFTNELDIPMSQMLPLGMCIVL